MAITLRSLPSSTHSTSAAPLSSTRSPSLPESFPPCQTLSILTLFFLATELLSTLSSPKSSTRTHTPLLTSSCPCTLASGRNWLQHGWCQWLWPSIQRSFQRGPLSRVGICCSYHSRQTRKQHQRVLILRLGYNIV